MASVVTRFAPSPTGFLHLGSARTALYSWLYAKQNKGSSILRIEDTDLERSTPQAIQAILDGLSWLGLDFDEGPYFQTHRLERYQHALEQLLEKGLAYRCVCSKERIERLRQEQERSKQKPRYDGRCREAKIPSDSNQPYVIRFKNPLYGEIIVKDTIHGNVSFQNSELDDIILARSDGMPTYNFCVVVDDWDMEVTHVLRGDDHLTNTPRQINILEALGGKTPSYTHLPMILGSDGQRLSKRHGAVSVQDFRAQGFLPQALLNYLVRLGWSHKDQEIFSLSEMVNLFSITRLNKSAAAINMSKLLWLNQHYLKTLDPKLLSSEMSWHLQRKQLDLQKGPPILDLFVAQKDRCKTLLELVEKSVLFYQDLSEYPNLTCIEAPNLKVIIEMIKKLESPERWVSAESLHLFLKEEIARAGSSFKELAPFLRKALTGESVSPPLDQTLFLLGQQKSLERLKKSFIA